MRPSKDGKPTTREVFAKFDYPGIIAFTAAIVTLLLGLQFGGSSYKWSDRRTIASLSVSGILFVSFFLLEWWQGDNAILPSKILGTRVVALASVYTATLDGAYFVLMYQVSNFPGYPRAEPALIACFHADPAMVSNNLWTVCQRIRISYYSSRCFLYLGRNCRDGLNGEASLLSSVHAVGCYTSDNRKRSSHNIASHSFKEMGGL